MAQSRENIRAQCGRMGIDAVQEHVSNGTHFNNEKEAGWAKEWLKDQDREALRDEREAVSIELTKQANKIADKAMRISWVSAIAAMVSAFIALVAVIMDKT